jgi:hypothetical protein
METCNRKVRAGCSAIITSTCAVTVPEVFWSISDPNCGDKINIFPGNVESLVLCWGCALANKLVQESEEEYSKRQLQWVRLREQTG